MGEGKARGNGGAMSPVFGDRLIPTRSTTNFELGYHAYAQAQEERRVEPLKLEPPNRFQEFIKRELNMKGRKDPIFGFSMRRALADIEPEPELVPASISKPMDKTARRVVATRPDKVLDAPCLFDDHYVHPIDWSAKNFLVAGLGDDIYAWVPESRHTQKVGHVSNYPKMVTFVRVVACDVEGTRVAAGMRNGEIWVFDLKTMKCTHRFDQRKNSVYALAWNGETLTAGTACSELVHYDLRQPPTSCISTVKAHDGDFICTLKWSPDFRHLASSGHDKTVRIWSAAGAGTSVHRPDPLIVFKRHKAVPQSLAWCPWQPGLIASGGAAPDKTIRLWSINSGTVRRERLTKAAVTSVHWSEEYQELISSHGIGDSHLYIWALPDLELVAKLDGHQRRVTDMVISHDQTTVITAGAEEAIKFWGCFRLTEERKEAKRKREWKLKRHPFNMLVR